MATQIIHRNRVVPLPNAWVRFATSNRMAALQGMLGSVAVAVAQGLEECAETS